MKYDYFMEAISKIVVKGAFIEVPSKRKSTNTSYYFKIKQHIKGENINHVINKRILKSESLWRILHMLNRFLSIQESLVACAI